MYKGLMSCDELMVEAHRNNEEAGTYLAKAQRNIEQAQRYIIISCLLMGLSAALLAATLLLRYLG